MIVHMAIFKWKKDITEEEIHNILNQLRGLKDKVQGLMEIHCGKNISKWANDYTHAVLVLAKNQEALDSYRNHPDHQKIARKIEEMEEDSIGVDFIS